MRITKIPLALALTAAAAGGVVAEASGSKAHRASGSTVELRETSLGMILSNSEGHTLYEFTADKSKKDKCVTISGCSTVWPPLTVSGTPTAGPGVNAKLLKTIMLPGGAMQVTYKNRPLYTYTGDSGPGETSYVGANEFGGKWYAMSAKGKPVKPKKSKAKSGEGEGGGGGYW